MEEVLAQSEVEAGNATEALEVKTTELASRMDEMERMLEDEVLAMDELVEERTQVCVLGSEGLDFFPRGLRVWSSVLRSSCAVLYGMIGFQECLFSSEPQQVHAAVSRLQSCGIGNGRWHVTLACVLPTGLEERRGCWGSFCDGR